jgi:hypothetical protein
MNLWWCRVPAEPASMIGPSKHADRDPRRAWVAVALLPVALVLAMVVGEGLISVLGYQSGSQEPVPVGPALLAGVPALLILIAPAWLRFTTAAGAAVPAVGRPSCLPGSAG